MGYIYILNYNAVNKYTNCFNSGANPLNFNRCAHMLNTEKSSMHTEDLLARVLGIQSGF